MKKNLSLSFYLFIVALTTFSCSKGDSKADNNSNNTTDPSFSYVIYDRLIGINCSDIAFVASPGDVMVDVIATHASSKVSFNFAFPASSSALETAGTGRFPVAAYSEFSNTNNLSAFQLSMKLPTTANGTDFYMSTTPTNSTHVNNVTKIHKGGIEGNRLVYWVEGNFSIPAENTAKQTTTVKGQYRFKLLTLMQ